MPSASSVRCPKGHDYTAENTLRTKRGRSCVICGKDRARRKDAKKLECRTKQPRVYASSKATQAKLDALWAALMARPETRYKTQMLEAKQEYDTWIASQKKERAKKKGTKGRPLACGANNP